MTPRSDLAGQWMHPGRLYPTSWAGEETEGIKWLLVNCKKAQMQKGLGPFFSLHPFHLQWCPGCCSSSLHQDPPPPLPNFQGPSAHRAVPLPHSLLAVGWVNDGDGGRDSGQWLESGKETSGGGQRRRLDGHDGQEKRDLTPKVGTGFHVRPSFAYRTRGNEGKFSLIPRCSKPFYFGPILLHVLPVQQKHFLGALRLIAAIPRGSCAIEARNPRPQSPSPGAQENVMGTLRRRGIKLTCSDHPPEHHDQCIANLEQSIMPRLDADGH